MFNNLLTACPSLTVSQTAPGFHDYKTKAFLKHSGKRKKCWLLAFSTFPRMSSTLSSTDIIIRAELNMSSANAFNLDQSNNFSVWYKADLHILNILFSSVVMVLAFGSLVQILLGPYISAMHLFICFFVTDFVCKMGARPGSAKEPFIPFNVQKMDFVPNRLSIINK